MRPLRILTNVIVGLSLSVYGASDDLVGDDRIKVFLFAKPAFWSEVAVDAYNNVCIDLDNNLIDGKVQSILIGGHDIWQVMSRSDAWYCTFYDNYDCVGDKNNTLVFGDGVNNLRSVNWEKKVHALLCQVEDA